MDIRVDIRSATDNDAVAISGLLSELGFPSSPTDVASRMARMPNATLLAVTDGRVVGLVTMNIMPVLHRPTPVGRLSALIVGSAERELGIGRALVEAAERHLKAQGCDLIEVTSNTRLTAAHAFYEHLGYEATSVRFKRELTA